MISTMQLYITQFLILQMIHITKITVIQQKE